MDRVRIGTLGTAKITPGALIKPASTVTDAVVVAVAAREEERARRFATKHGIARVHRTYDDLLADPEVDAVYNPLPNGLHGHWTIRALDAGKHVLCEKPFTANAEEAMEVAAATERAGRVVMEAFHYRYHPLADRMREVLASGVLGRVRHVETWVCFPLLNRRDIRFRLDLAGGATMDAGCYAIHMARLLGNGEPQVTRAEARLSSPGVDRWMRADLMFPDGRTGRITCSLLSAHLIKVAALAVGDEGSMQVFNPLSPQYYHRLTIRTASGKSRERIRSETTYVHQLRAFVGAVLGGRQILTPPADAVANMRVIDDVYRKAGLEPRQPSSS